MFEQVARELRAKLMRERPLGHQAGHLASRAGRRPPAQTAARPNKRHHMAPGTPMDAETQRPEHRRTSRTPAAPQQHVVSYNPWPQPTKTPTFPRNKAEKSPLQQHDLSILIVGPNQLKKPTFPHQHNEKSTLQQHVVSYNPNTDFPAQQSRKVGVKGQKELVEG